MAKTRTLQELLRNETQPPAAPKTIVTYQSVEIAEFGDDTVTITQRPSYLDFVGVNPDGRVILNPQKARTIH